MQSAAELAMDLKRAHQRVDDEDVHFFGSLDYSSSAQSTYYLLHLDGEEQYFCICT